MNQPITIWFNRGLSSLADLIPTIRASQQEGESFRFLVTHPDENTRVRNVADVFEREPKPQSVGEYISWCLDVVERHDVKVLFAGSYAPYIHEAALLFARRGCAVISAGGHSIQALLKDKGKLYGVVPEGMVPMPWFTTVRDAGSFVQAVASANSEDLVCFKPTQGLGGQGFHVISKNGEQHFSPWNGELLSISLEGALSELCGQPQGFPDVMVMQYLDGQETSVDCFATNGVLHAAIARVKAYDAVDELLADAPDLIEYCRSLTALLTLEGLYNVQFKLGAGKQYLLEINGRMAGGLHYGVPSGVNLAYWAIRMAIRTAGAEDIPVPKTGIRVPRVVRVPGAAPVQLGQ
ncbi:MAG TPA: ATP-grasp domain-containing protein [Planktothrix sp.]|jgi:biotin carboxylase